MLCMFMALSVLFEELVDVHVLLNATLGSHGAGKEKSTPSGPSEIMLLYFKSCRKLHRLS